MSMKSHSIVLIIGLISVCIGYAIGENGPPISNEDCLACLSHAASLPAFSDLCPLEQIFYNMHCLCGKLRGRGFRWSDDTVTFGKHGCSTMIREARMYGGCPFRKLIRNARTICADGVPTTTTTAMPTTPPSVSEWPIGKFAFPMTIDRNPCPAGFENGTVHQKTDGNHDEISANHRLAAVVSNHSISVSYCVKTDDAGTGNWPNGSYCINRYDDFCPDGFEGGFIFWDDNDHIPNLNANTGKVPDALYDITAPNTRMVYCCRNDGDILDEVALPMGDPFVLYPLQGSTDCQVFTGYYGSFEYIVWDTSDSTHNIDHTGGLTPKVELSNTTIKLYFCYYEINY